MTVAPTGQLARGLAEPSSGGGCGVLPGDTSIRIAALGEAHCPPIQSVGGLTRTKGGVRGPHAFSCVVVPPRSRCGHRKVGSAGVGVLT